MAGDATAGVAEHPRAAAPVTARRTQRVAIGIVLFLAGLDSRVWAARVPAVREHLGLSSGRLGLALLGPAVGAVVAMPATGFLLGHVAPRRIVRVVSGPERWTALG